MKSDLTANGISIYL